MTWKQYKIDWDWPEQLFPGGNPKKKLCLRKDKIRLKFLDCLLPKFRLYYAIDIIYIGITHCQGI